jgi:hypothetical protein
MCPIWFQSQLVFPDLPNVEMLIYFHVIMIVLTSVITPRGHRRLSGVWLLCWRQFLTVELLNRLMVIRL